MAKSGKVKGSVKKGVRNNGVNIKPSVKIKENKKSS
jgi:hypothetical protein